MIIHAIVTILVEATNQRIAARSDRTRWIALFVVCLGQLMIVLDTTIVNVALPSIQRDLHFSQSSLTWVIDGYLITFGSLLLLAGLGSATCSAASESSSSASPPSSSLR